MTAHDSLPPIRLADANGPYPEPLSLLGVTNVVLRNRRTVVAIMIGVAAVGSVLALMAPRRYTSTASFIPASRRTVSPTAGIAAQFGISMPGADAQQSPDFYVALLHSKVVLDDVIVARYAFDTEHGRYQGTLLDYYGGTSGPLPQRRDAALRALNGQIATGTSLKTGGVTLAVTSASPTLAADIARNLLSALDHFNRTRQQGQSAQEKRFMEEQMESAAGELRVAEERMQSFQEQNRDYTRSPRLAFEHERLQRDVNMRQQLYSSLAQSYAQARMDAVRDNPSVVVLESPEVPPYHDPRGLIRTGVLSLFAGLLLGIFVAFFREHVVRTRQLHPDEEEEYRSLRAETARDLRNPFRLLGIGKR